MVSLRVSRHLASGIVAVLPALLQPKRYLSRLLSTFLVLPVRHNTRKTNRFVARILE
uniref:Uncharacterized protein n=1 Tax=Helianthus annuus TaxID=4232 RepID=A0A251TUM0_HELAN